MKRTQGPLIALLIIVTGVVAILVGLKLLLPGYVETRVVAEAKARGIAVEKGVFPWAASGRARATARDEGMTKLLFDKSSRRLLGAGLVGPNAGELIAEAVLALEMGADAEDIALTIHSHPTLSETVMFAAEIAEGTITDLYMPRK